MTLTVAGNDLTRYLREGSLVIRRYGALRSSFFATLHFSAVPETFPLVGEEITVSHNGAVIWGGILIETEGECSSTSSADISLRGEGYEHILQRFCLPALSIPEITPSNAAIFIFNNYIPQAEGLSLGTVDAGTSLKSPYQFHPAKASAVFDRLAGENGYRWWVDENKAFHMKKILPRTSATMDIDLTGQSSLRLRDLQTLTFFSSVAGYRNVQYVYNRTTNIAQRAINTAEIAKMEERYGSGRYGAATSGATVKTTDDAKALAEELLSTAQGTDEIRFTTDDPSFVPGKLIPVTAPLFGIRDRQTFCVTETKAVYFANRFRYTVTAKQATDNSGSDARWEQILANRSEPEMR